MCIIYLRNLADYLKSVLKHLNLFAIVLAITSVIFLSPSLLRSTYPNVKEPSINLSRENQQRFNLQYKIAGLRDQNLEEVEDYIVRFIIPFVSNMEDVYKLMGSDHPKFDKAVAWFLRKLKALLSRIPTLNALNQEPKPVDIKCYEIPYYFSGKCAEKFLTMYFVNVRYSKDFIEKSQEEKEKMQNLITEEIRKIIASESGYESFIKGMKEDEIMDTMILFIPSLKGFTDYIEERKEGEFKKVEINVKQGFVKMVDFEEFVKRKITDYVKSYFETHQERHAFARSYFYGFLALFAGCVCGVINHFNRK